MCAFRSGPLCSSIEPVCLSNIGTVFQFDPIWSHKLDPLWSLHVKSLTVIPNLVQTIPARSTKYPDNISLKLTAHHQSF